MMTEPSRVAVILVNYNGGDIIIRCLQALLKQTFTPHRILLVDNASQDDSLSAIEKQFPEVEIIAAERNLGFCAANNLAVKQAQDCPWVALLNPDAFPQPDWLEQLMQAAQKYPECHSFGSTQLRADDESRLDGTGDVYHVSGMSWRRDYGCPASDIPRESDEIFSPCAAAALYQREVFLKAGGFDETFFLQLEDVDLGFRLRLMGYRCRHVPTAVVHHMGSAFMGKGSDTSIYYAHRNRVWVYVKNMPGRLFWRYLPQHIGVNICILIGLSLKGHPGSIIKANWHAVKELKRVWRQRRQIQDNCIVPVGELLKLMPKGWRLPYAGKKRFAVWK